MEPHRVGLRGVLAAERGSSGMLGGDEVQTINMRRADERERKTVTTRD